MANKSLAFYIPINASYRESLLVIEEKVETLDHHDKKVIFVHGENLIAALIADEYLEIYK
ncbi:MAG: hypothetical protein ACTSQI_17455 [Candidatus Helarchaeota archaeon]